MKQIINLKNKTILITGAAGFIGAALCTRLLRDYPTSIIIGLDNMNDYYEVELKEERLRKLSESDTNHRFIFVKGSMIILSDYTLTCKENSKCSG